MGALALLALMTGALALGILDDSDTHVASDAPTPETDDPDPMPPEPEDVGATFDVDDTTGTVTIDL